MKNRLILLSVVVLPLIMPSTLAFAKSSSKVSAPTTYAQAISTITQIIKKHFHGAIEMPKPTSLLDLRPNYPNLLVSSTPTTYDIGLYAGSKLPINSSNIIIGDANLIFTLHAQKASLPVSIEYQIPFWHFKHPKITHVALGSGIEGVLAKEINGNTVEEQSLTWTENHWKWSIFSTYGQDPIVFSAKKFVHHLRHLQLPASSGSGLFSFGADSPSQTMFIKQGIRYSLTANAWLAPDFTTTLTTR